MGVQGYVAPGYGQAAPSTQYANPQLPPPSQYTALPVQDYTAPWNFSPVAVPMMPPMSAAPHPQFEKKRKAPQVIDLTDDVPPARRPRKSAPALTASIGEGTWEPARYQRKVKVREADDKGDNGRKRKSAAPMKPVKDAKGKSAKTDGGEDTKAKKSKDEEKRLRRHRARAPTAYNEVRDRALTQRMFALDRERNNDNPDHPTETISLAGTTGNVYTIMIDKVPKCNCPHAKKGNQCKHIAYVMSRVLRAPVHLEYQLALLSSELRELFAHAPPLPSETAESDIKDGNRKPIEDECPICCVDFEPDSGEDIVYCKASCGNNIHKNCFNQWARSKTGGDVTCPFCRSPWQTDSSDVKHVAMTGNKNAEGYVNVASQLGLSGRRDYSSYNSYWVRNQAGRGRIAWDDDGVMDHEYRQA